MQAVDQLSAMLADLDILDDVQSKFAEEVAGAGGASWAIECYAADVFYARQLARIVRPLLEAYEKTDAAEWIAMVKQSRREITDRLLNLHGRHNSTSLLQNAVNQWEAEAMSRFIQQLNYIRWE